MERFVRRSLELIAAQFGVVDCTGPEVEALRQLARQLKRDATFARVYTGDMPPWYYAASEILGPELAESRRRSRATREATERALQEYVWELIAPLDPLLRSPWPILDRRARRRDYRGYLSRREQMICRWMLSKREPQPGAPRLAYIENARVDIPKYQKRLLGAERRARRFIRAMK